MSAIYQLEIPVAQSRRRHLRALPDVATPVAVSARVSPARMARRRFAALLVLLVVVGGAFLAGRALASTAGASTDRVTVHQGDTLSGLATHLYPQMSTDEAVAKLQQANDLPSVHVVAGQTLVAPR